MNSYYIRVVAWVICIGIATAVAFAFYSLIQTHKETPKPRTFINGKYENYTSCRHGVAYNYDSIPMISVDGLPLRCETRYLTDDQM